MADRSVRSLLLLENSGSTARVLNLHRQWKKLDGAEREGVPFFQNPVMDRAFVVKHRLRRDEADLFADRRGLATKVLLPIDPTDLKLGANSFFVGQSHLEDKLAAMFGEDFCASADHKLLNILDELPTLDPFLLREHLKRNGREPARRYFEVSDADLKRMFAFVQAEITPLVQLSLGVTAGETQTAKLVSKILQSGADDDMEPLRLTLQLARHEYEEGVFCWKGFLYYKWCLGELIGGARRVAEEIGAIKPAGPLDPEARESLERSRVVLRRGVVRACSAAAATLKVYDDAYANLTRNGRPSAFREFLLEAPTLFSALGAKLGAVSHIVSFWRFRFPPGQPRNIAPEELMDIFMDFETGLNISEAEIEARVAA